VISRTYGGEGGIRTPDTVTRMPHFECGAFNRSATSPMSSAKQRHKPDGARFLHEERRPRQAEPRRRPPPPLALRTVHARRRGPNGSGHVQIPDRSPHLNILSPVTACKEKNLALYVLPPKRPELNGAVERAQSSWRYEFYACYDLPARLDKLQTYVDAFAHRFNHVRPHDALDGKTPAEYLQTISAAPPSHMS
jgi:hypothetical protein